MLGVSNRPDWDALWEIASSQEGLFTTKQAEAAGYYPQLLHKYIKNGRINRIRRGIYRVVHFPPGEHEDLVAVWLWADQAGVFSHDTALFLHDLSDALPARVHLTLPLAWQERRLRVPKGVSLHYGHIQESERSWVGAVPVTQPLRTIEDCARNHVSPELVEQALVQANERGLITKAQMEKLKARTP